MEIAGSLKCDFSPWKSFVPTKNFIQFETRAAFFVPAVTTTLSVFDQIFTTPVELDSAIAKNLPIKPLPVVGSIVEERHRQRR